MTAQKNPDLHDEESTLNPPPKAYKVSFFTKCIFLCIFALGLLTYTYFIVDRRVSQHRFLMDNQMAAIKLTPTSLPHLNVYDVKTNTHKSLNEKGRFTLLNIWATWCPSCREEMPSLELLQQKFEGKLSIVALSVDDNLDPVKEFIALNHPSFQVYWDKEKISSQKLGINKYPETFLIAPDGTLIAQFSGARDWAKPYAIDYFLNILE